MVVLIIHTNKHFIIEQKVKIKNKKQYCQEIFQEGLRHYLHISIERGFEKNWIMRSSSLGIRFEKDDEIKRGACGEHLQGSFDVTQAVFLLV